MSDPIEAASPEPEAWNPAETYKRNDPVGWCGDKSRGAAMGRTSIMAIPEDHDSPGFTIYVERVFIDDQGYDPNGTQFGIGMPLFWIYAQTEVERIATWLLHKPKYTEPATLDYCERFVDLEDAVRVVKETWPAANVIGSEAWCDELVEKFLDEERERERDEEEKRREEKEAERCADATLHPDDDDLLEDILVATFLRESVVKPPSCSQERWDTLIKRVYLSENVCERLMRIEMASGESESIDTGAVCELFEDASRVTGIPLTNKFEQEDEPEEEDTYDEDSNNDDERDE